MKRRAKLEDIVWVAERGERYIIPERQHDWLMLCLKNANSKKSVEVMVEFLSILRMLSKEDLTIEQIDRFVDLGKYKWLGGDWLAYQVCKYSPRGEELVREAKIPVSPEMQKKIDDVLEENKAYTKKPEVR